VRRGRRRKGEEMAGMNGRTRCTRLAIVEVDLSLQHVSASGKCHKWSIDREHLRKSWVSFVYLK